MTRPGHTLVSDRREARRRDLSRVLHPLPEILLVRILAIACGYEDADDLDRLRADPAFTLAFGRLPESGADLMSHPPVSQPANTLGLRIRSAASGGRSLLRQLPRPPAAVILDIDDTCDVVHGHQRPSLINAHHGERCFLPIHV